MAGRRSISKIKLLLIIGVVATFGATLPQQVRAGDVTINMEVCTETNAEPTITMNYADNSTVFSSPVSLNFLTDWVYQATTSRSGAQLAQSTIEFEENQSFSQSINLLPGANALTIVFDGGCPRHDVTQTLNLNYDPNGISVNHQTTANASPEITGKVGINNHKIKVTVNNQTYNATNNGDGTWVLPADTIQPALLNGTYDVQVQLIDNVTSTVLKDVVEAGALVINQAAPTVTVNPLVANQSSPELTGNISSADSQIRVTINGVSHNATNTGNGTWILSAGTIQPELADGDYDVLVEAINPITHATEAAATLTPGLRIDTIAPKVTINTTKTSNRRPEITGTVDDPAAEVTVEINGKTYGATNNGDGTWTLPADVIAPLASGQYDLKVTARDGAGNISEQTITFTVDAEGDLGFFLPPMTGYFRINRTNIPSWLVYLVILGLIYGGVRLKQRSKRSSSIESAQK